MKTGRMNIVLSFFCIIFFLSGCASDESKVKELVTQAQAYFDAGEYPKALIQLKNAIKIDNSSEDAYQLMVKIFLKQGNGQDAFRALLRLEQINEANIDTKMQVASFYLLSKEKNEVERRVDQVLAQSPDNIQALYLKTGVMALKKEDIEQIKSVFLKILDIDSNQARAHFFSGQTIWQPEKGRSSTYPFKKSSPILNRITSVTVRRCIGITWPVDNQKMLKK
jgi:Tfp pilus assembly protein PilF